MFDIKNKVAIITGGCGGIGLEYAQAFLENGAKTIALFDIDEEKGLAIENEHLEKHGPNKLLFVKTDITDFNSFKSSFDTVIDVCGQLDIVINNAGIFNELKPANVININVIGTIHGCDLAQDYLAKYKSSEEGLILNTASVAGLVKPLYFQSAYNTSKTAIIHYGRCIGHPENHKNTKVKVITICPGITITSQPINEDVVFQICKPAHIQAFVEYFKSSPMQSVETLISTVMSIIKKAESGSVWVIEGGNEKLIEFPTIYT